MKVAQNKFVSVDYKLTVDGQIADQSSEGHPLEFIFGTGMLLPKFEAAILGKEVGDKVSFTLEPKDGYGELIEEAIVDLPKNIFMIDGKLAEKHLEFEDNAAVCVVLASEGYPVKYEKGIPMYGFENFENKDGYYCFHAGTKLKDGQIVTNGGRVLGITATGKDLKEARKNAYEATEWITFANKYMRHDIGKAIDEA